jgi:RNA-directed DNA polymerase
MSDLIVKTEKNDNNITWNNINWGKIQSKVRKVQYRIYRARKNGNMKRVHWLQRRLVNSLDAKLVATHRVTTLNKGKMTAGIDKKVLTKPHEKYELAISLKLDGTAQPIRRVWIDKPGKPEKRPLGIPIIRDRAKQQLARLGLEPEWEAIFEPNSYGFREGRGCHDAIEAIFLNLRGGTPKWVFDADIKKWFDQIDHNALLDKLGTFPLMHQQIKAWLKAGVMEGYANSSKPSEVVETTVGTPQGGVISPLLVNIALHGLEEHLLEFVGNLPLKPHPGANRGKAAKKKALGVVRYADDFVITHRNKKILELCIAETHSWLAKVGLAISLEKSSLRDARNGFNFLGFQIIVVRKPNVGSYKVKIQPSKKKQLDLLAKIKKSMAAKKSISSYDLISMLRPIILGWANYYKYCECKQVFSKLTNIIFRKLRAWVFRRDTRNGRFKVKEKYFPSGKTYYFDGSSHNDNWILNGKKKTTAGLKENFLPHIVWVKSRKHVKVKQAESPYSNSIYWALRSKKHSPYSTRVTKLLQKQNQLCPWCSRTFDTFDAQNWEVDHIIPRGKGGKDTYDNLQLLHKQCHIEKTISDKKSE